MLLHFVHYGSICSLMHDIPVCADPVKAVFLGGVAFIELLLFKKILLSTISDGGYFACV